MPTHKRSELEYWPLHGPNIILAQQDHAPSLLGNGEEDRTRSSPADQRDSDEIILPDNVRQQDPLPTRPSPQETSSCRSNRGPGTVESGTSCGVGRLPVPGTSSVV